MTTTQTIRTNHPATGAPHGVSIPARRPTRQFVPAPVHNPTPVQVASNADSDALSTADAVLQLLRSVNRNR